jgi:hypothetical protein
MARTFADTADPPTEETLAAQLGSAWPAMRSVLELAASFKRDWNPGTAGAGMFKVHDGRKALWYLIPRQGSFTISMAVREAEREALLADPAAEAVHSKLESARKYAEGFALKIEIGSEADLAAVEPFLRALIALRE